MFEKVMYAADDIREKSGGLKPKIAVVLGTNFDQYVARCEIRCEMDYREIKGFPASKNMVHPGRLVFTEIAGHMVALLVGRYHCYEGYTPAETVIPLRALAILGAETALLTNAAGGINEAFRRGDLMAITDHINMTGLNVLMGENIHQLGKRYPDMTAAYDPALTALLLEAAKENGIEMQQGIYGYMPGPSFETPAEIRALGRLGADAVGMSTVHETVAAVHAGMRVAAFSCISNMAAGISGAPITGEEVEGTLTESSETIALLLNSWIAKL